MLCLVTLFAVVSNFLITGSYADAPAEDPTSTLALTVEEEAILSENPKLPVPGKLKAITNHSTLNVLVSNRPGFGDVASNLQMVDILREKYPGIKINIILQRGETQEKMAKLIQGFDEKRSLQKVGGSLYWVADIDPLPSADALLSFSTTDTLLAGSDKILSTAPVALGFTEFGDFDWATMKTRRMPLDERYPRLKPQVIGSTFMLNTGALEGGYYISKDIPPAKHSAAQLITAVKENTGSELVGKALTVDATTEIGFSYTFRPKPSLDYVTAISRKALENPKRNFVVIVSGSKPKELGGLAPNLQVIYVKNMPYELSKECVAGATLPVMITGDGSLNLALEYGKPFFYETNHWKQESVRALRQSLGSTEAFRGNKNSFDLLKSALPATAVDLADPTTSDVDTIYKAVSDSRFQNDFKLALKQSRSKNVLVENIEKVVNFISSQPEVTPESFKKFVKNHFTSSSGPGCCTIRQLMTPKHSANLIDKYPQRWIPILKNPEAGILKLVAEKDFSLLSEITNAFHDHEFMLVAAKKLGTVPITPELEKFLYGLVAKNDPLIWQILAEHTLTNSNAVQLKELMRKLIQTDDQKVLRGLINGIFTRPFEIGLKDLVRELMLKSDGDTFNDFVRTVFSHPGAEKLDDLLALAIERAPDPKALDEIKRWAVQMSGRDRKAWDMKHLGAFLTALGIKDPQERSLFLRQRVPEFFEPNWVPTQDSRIIAPSFRIHDQIRTADGRIIKVESRVDEGRRSRVYRVTDLKGKQFALKIAKDDGAETLRSFADQQVKTEALNRSGIAHAGLVEPGKNYLLMEWVDGQRADAWIEDWVARGMPATDPAALALRDLVQDAAAKGVYIGDLYAKKLIWTGTSWTVIDSGSVHESKTAKEALSRYLEKLPARWNQKAGSCIKDALENLIRSGSGGL